VCYEVALQRARLGRCLRRLAGGHGEDVHKPEYKVARERPA
jgi:hypothetical protein